MKRLAALAALAPVAAFAHPADGPHAHADDPLLLAGLGTIAVLLAVAVVMKRRS